MYAEFGSKQGLFEAALERYDEKHLTAVLAPIEAPDAGARGIREAFTIPERTIATGSVTSKSLRVSSLGRRAFTRTSPSGATTPSRATGRASTSGIPLRRGTPRPVSFTECNGNQGDVVDWDDIPVRSSNSPASGTQNCDGKIVPAGFEGVHIFDISNLEDPVLVGSVETACGSHTATGVPDVANDRAGLPPPGGETPRSRPPRTPTTPRVLDVVGIALPPGLQAGAHTAGLRSDGREPVAEAPARGDHSLHSFVGRFRVPPDRSRSQLATVPWVVS